MTTVSPKLRYMSNNIKRPWSRRAAFCFMAFLATAPMPEWLPETYLSVNRTDVVNKETAYAFIFTETF